MVIIELATMVGIQRNACNALAPPVRKLPVGSSFSGLISWVDIAQDDVHVFIVPAEKKKEFDELDLNLQQCEKKNFNERPQRETFCLGYYQNAWARGVCCPLGNTGEYKVFFFDYGNRETLPFESIKQLPQMYFNVESQCVHCIMYGKCDHVRSKVEEVRSSLQTGEYDVKVQYMSTSEVLVVDLYQRSGSGADSVYVNDMIMVPGTTCYGVQPTPGQELSKYFRTKRENMQCQQLDVGSKASVTLCAVGKVGDLQAAATLTDGKTKSRYEGMARSMQQVYAAAGKPAGEQVWYGPVVTEVVAGYYQNEWYRAEVQAVDEGARTAQLFYVDYGNVEQVAFTDIRALRSDFKDLPMLVLSISLDKLDPSYMLKVTEIDEPFTQVIHLEVMSKRGDHSSNWSYSVRLYTSDGQRCLNDELMQQHPNAAMASAPKTVKFVDEQKRIMRSHVPAVRIPPGKKIPCQFVDYHSPTDAYVFVMPEGAKYDEALQVPTILSTVQPGTVPYRPLPDEMVVAKFQGDWYRGCVVDVNATTATIFFVDFGNTDPVNLTELKPLQHDVMNQEMLAVRIRLANADPSFNFGAVLESSGCQPQCMIEAVGERGSVLDVLPVRLYSHDGLKCVNDLAPAAPAPAPPAPTPARAAPTPTPAPAAPLLGRVAPGPAAARVSPQAPLSISRLKVVWYRV